MDALINIICFSYRKGCLLPGDRTSEEDLMEQPHQDTHVPHHKVHRPVCTMIEKRVQACQPLKPIFFQRRGKWGRYLLWWYPNRQYTY